MRKHHFQPQLIDTPAQILNIQQADIEYRPEFIQPQSAWALFDEILSETNWRQEQIHLFGKTHKTPRLSCWMADAGLDYSYSNMTMQPVAWSKTLVQIKRKVEQAAQYEFNSVLLNYYRDGKDSNGWHADDEPELGRNPVIASLSLGGTRDFDLRHKQDKTQKQRIALQHGSLLVMRGTTQHFWQHCIPKRVQADARINLTFRTIKK